jgi:apolipoprotein N-acyltransferase
LGENSQLKAYLWALTSGLLMALAWWQPGSSFGALLGWASSLALVGAVLHPQCSYKTIYAAGVVQTLLGFYWLFDTIRLFGGFPWYAAGAVFALFVAVSALQNVVFLFVYRRLPDMLSRAGLAVAIAWVCSEWISIRIFPWYFGHTQLGSPALSQVADLAGVPLLSFVLLWVSECFFRLIGRRPAPGENTGTSLLRTAAVCVVVSALLFYGNARWNYFAAPQGQSLKVALVQANISIEEKHNMRFFGENKARYVRLTSDLPPDAGLVVWPESVVQDFIPARVGLASRDRRIPHFPGKHLLTGALTYESEKEFFNSAMQVLSDGSVPVPYHKQILMPFGEYMPGGSIFPALNNLNPAGGQFSAGKDVMVMEFPKIVPDPGSGISGIPQILAAPLICYEDVVPSLSRRAVEKGAELLINLTNDAWFGDTIAPYQHHLIAAFRAIETRRFLLRSTNSGLTGIVSPRGETMASIPTYSEGLLQSEIRLLREKTPYTEGVGDIPWWTLTLLCLLSCLRKKPLTVRNHEKK